MAFDVRKFCTESCLQQSAKKKHIKQYLRAVSNSAEKTNNNTNALTFISRDDNHQKPAPVFGYYNIIVSYKICGHD